MLVLNSKFIFKAWYMRMVNVYAKKKKKKYLKLSYTEVNALE